MAAESRCLPGGWPSGAPRAVGTHESIEIPARARASARPSTTLSSICPGSIWLTSTSGGSSVPVKAWWQRGRRRRRRNVCASSCWEYRRSAAYRPPRAAQGAIEKRPRLPRERRIARRCTPGSHRTRRRAPPARPRSGNAPRTCGRARVRQLREHFRRIDQQQPMIRARAQLPEHPGRPLQPGPISSTVRPTLLERRQLAHDVREDLFLGRLAILVGKTDFSYGSASSEAIRRKSSNEISANPPSLWAISTLTIAVSLRRCRWPIRPLRNPA